MVLRGYDRIEVDEYIEKLLEENAALRRELESAAARVRVPEQRDDEQATQAMVPPVPTPPVQGYDIDTPAEDSFGFRAEKLLRLAEREAVEMRTRATRDAESLEATARRRADEQLRAAEREADQIRERAAQEVARVGRLHRTTRDELRRLAGVLNAELERPDPTGDEELVAPSPEPHASTA
jgi:cell division septum initiation protein DivIVA